MGSRASLSEQLSHQQRRNQASMREEQRLKFLYDSAADVIKKHQVHQREISSQLLKAHWATTKVYMHILTVLTEEKGHSVSDDNARQDMPPAIQSSLDVMAWDRHMLEKVLHWLRLKLPR